MTFTNTIFALNLCLDLPILSKNIIQILLQTWSMIYVIIYLTFEVAQIMANVQGFRNLRERQQENRPRAPFNPNAQVPDGPLQEEYRKNKIPFLRPMQTDRAPLQQTVAYTIKLIWCPFIKPFNPSIIFLIMIWVLYIICCTQGIDSSTGILTIQVDVLIRFGAVKKDLIKDGEIWRLITAAFLHIDLLHITMNSLSILFFLTRLQQVYHQGYMVLLMIVSAIAGNILSCFNDDNVISAGASTILFGALGVYVAYMLMNWQVLQPVRTQLCCIVGFVVFLSIISSFTSRVDALAHFGGLFGGFLISLAAFPSILQKNKIMMGIGAGGLAGYFVTTFLVFYLS